MLTQVKCGKINPVRRKMTLCLLPTSFGNIILIRRADTVVSTQESDVDPACECFSLHLFYIRYLGRKA